MIFQVTAQATYITGTAKGAEGKKLLVRTFADYISGREITLGYTTIDSTGNFSLSIPLRSTIYAWFEIDYYAGEVYLDPGTHHVFTLKGIVFNEKTDRINGNLEQQTISVIPDSSDRLNIQLRKFNVTCNQLLIRYLGDESGNPFELMSKSFRIAVDSLKLVCDTVFAKNGSSFINDYIKYRFASLQYMNLQNSTQKLFFSYLFHQPVLYNNIEYMGFFRQYYENYFTAVNRPFRTEHLRYLINTDAPYAAILDSMGADTLLQNEVLREVVLLEALRTAYATSGFKRSSVLRVIGSMVSEARFPEHREIAKNLLYMLTRYESGKPAPDFALMDEKGDTIQLSDFKNKIVYLHFFTTWNTASLEEMEFMRTLQSKYASSVQFVSICCDREYMKMYHFARDQKFPWPLLHFNGDYQLLDALGVKTYPYFILVDTEGRFLLNPAESPSGNIESRLNTILEGKN